MRSEYSSCLTYVLSLSIGLSAVVAPAPSYANMTDVNNGATTKIDAHGTCRMITNASGVKMMVPWKEGSEWATGDNAFLQNLSRMQGVSAAACSSPVVSCASSRQPAWGSYLHNNTYVKESYYSQRWWWTWEGAVILDTRDMMTYPSAGGWDYSVTYSYYEADNDDISYNPIWRIRSDDKCVPKVDSPNRLKPENVAARHCRDYNNWGRCGGQNTFGTYLNLNARQYNVWSAGQRAARCLEPDGYEATTSVTIGNETWVAPDGITMLLVGALRVPQYSDWYNNFDILLQRRAYFMPPGLDTCYVEAMAYLSNSYSDRIHYIHTFTRGVNGVQ